MFTNLSDRASAELATLRRILRAHEELREELFPTQPDAEAHADALVLRLRDVAPQKADWLVHDHCSAVMRIYAIFEQCIEDLAREYLGEMPVLFPTYNELPPATITQHRIGVAHILQRLAKEGHYARHSEADVLRGIAEGNAGRPYSLLVDAFLIDPQNYRADLIIKVFRTLGFEDIWSGAEKFSSLRDFMQSRDPNEDPKGLLKKIVDERNLASHTRPTDFWAPDEMQSLSTFVEILVRSICEIIDRSTVLRRRDLGMLADVGKVIHKFRNDVRGVELVKTRIVEGDKLIAVAPETAAEVTVLSLCRHRTPVALFEAESGDQLGVCFDCDLPKGTLLLRAKVAQQLDLSEVPQAPPVESESLDDQDAGDNDPDFG